MEINIRRFFTGGILGAIIGIMLAGFFEKQWLLLLSFPGTFLGYHIQNTKTIFLESFKKCSYFWKKLSNKVKLFANRCFTFPKFVEKKTKEKTVGFISRCFYFLIKVILKVIASPKSLIDWLKEHPINRAYFLSGLIGVLYFATTIISVYLLLQYLTPESITTFDKMNGKVIVLDRITFELIFGTSFIVLFLFLVPPLLFWEKKEEERHNLGWTDYKRYTRKGILNWIYSDIKYLIMKQIMYLYVVFTGTLYVAIIGGIIVSFLFFPAMVFILMIHGFYEIVIKKGGWTCAIITTLITVISGFIFWESIISNFTLRWLIALATGSFAGFISWQVSKLVEKITKIEIIKTILSEKVDFFDGVWLLTKKPASLFPKGLGWMLKPVEAHFNI